MGKLEGKKSLNGCVRRHLCYFNSWDTTIQAHEVPMSAVLNIHDRSVALRVGGRTGVLSLSVDSLWQCLQTSISSLWSSHYKIKDTVHTFEVMWTLKSADLDAREKQATPERLVNLEEQSGRVWVLRRAKPRKHTATGRQTVCTHVGA